MQKKFVCIIIAIHFFMIAIPVQAKDLKILLNAEPFGFGPSAAIAEIFPYLHEKIEHLSYIGTGHTLDLQRNLPYDHVYDYGASDQAHQKVKFNEIAKDYDIFITASNYEAAQWAKDLGLKLIIYDMLTWYWQILPSIICKADLYIAQDFFGVTERINDKANNFPQSVIIPAIVSNFYQQKLDTDQNIALINVGGLSNPFMHNEDFILFAKTIFDAANETLQAKSYNIHYAASRAIASNIEHIYPIKTLQPQQVQTILHNSKIAIMTSGLGNIYEASMLQKFVIWLPPANDSQGQQIKLLEQHGMIDFAIDWHDILKDEAPIDYFASQEEVLQHIARCIQKLSKNSIAQEIFKSLLNDACHAIETQNLGIPKLAKLAQTFKINGAQYAAETIFKKIIEFNND